MPLAELQAALGTMIAEQAATGCVSSTTQTAIRNLPLTPAEQDWLQALLTQAGFRVSCDIQRWWRETRLRETARLTLAALGKEQTDSQLATYLSTHLCHSLFFLPETLRFLQFVAAHTTQPLVRAVAQFERALLRVSETMEEAWIEFCAPPEEVLAAVLQGKPLPTPTTERYEVLVSAHLPQLWCVT